MWQELPVQCQSPGCNFFGKDETAGLCSACFKSLNLNSQQQPFYQDAASAWPSQQQQAFYPLTPEQYAAEIRRCVPSMSPEDVLDWVDSFLALGLSFPQIEPQLRDVALKHARLALFEDGLRGLGYEVVVIPGRGDCLFGAVAHQIYGDETLHPLVRQACVEYLRVLHSAGGTSKPTTEYYLHELSKPGVWGDDMCAQALSDIYARPLFVYQADGANNYAPVPNYDFHPELLPGGAYLVLSNFDATSHFNSVVSADTLRHRVDPQLAGAAEAAALERVREHAAAMGTARAAAAAAEATEVQGEAVQGPATAEADEAAALAAAELSAAGSAGMSGGGSASASTASAAAAAPATAPDISSGGGNATPKGLLATLGTRSLEEHIEENMQKALARAASRGASLQRSLGGSSGGGVAAGSAQGRSEKESEENGSSSSSSSSSSSEETSVKTEQ